MGEEVRMAETAAATASEKPAHFVLVHGIGGGAWCWYKIRSLMESSGYAVSCLDLTSAGVDPTDPNTVLTFDEYNKPLLDFLSTLPEDEQGVPDLSGFGDVHDLTFGLGPDKPPTSTTMKQEFQRSIIYQMSPLEDSTLAAMLLKPGPVTALMTAKFPEEEAEGVERVRRVYIKTAQDRVVKPEQQDSMIARWPPGEVFTLDSDHSPFFSVPFLLFGLLVKVAASCG
ncbi:methylesterase 17 isoform X2 [Rhodamnia argentea]|uniref:Methylesterase 17 isoform X2 n=1 Tax=Rhodamnia argentea TaxID=178133 RepID=A0ABM3HCT5_9MYRT|nr:methylesterase 17 isoform X2 [Rhodamnia argentea]